MKHAIAGILLAGTAGIVQAQTQVTLYGIVDAGYMYDKTEGQSAIHGIQSGNHTQSRFGLRGTEDLGNGLQALFVLENRFTTDTGSWFGNRLFQGGSYVGLNSKTAGEVKLGRFMGTAFTWAGMTGNPFGLGYGRSTLGTAFAYNDPEFGNGFTNNAIYYTTPVMAGLQGSLGYSFAQADAEVPGAGNNNRMMEAGARYTRAGLRAVATWQYVKTVSGQRNPQNLTLAAAYDFGPLTVHAAYGRLHNSNGALYGVRNDHAYSIGVNVPVGSGQVLAGYQRATGSKVDNIAVGYSHAMSKRTTLYAYFNTGDSSSGAVAIRKEQKQLSMGLLHRF
ncbi:Outer membrane porin protein precursor [Pigmentiphaga humi]|uniref:Outer membrane porin protein n=1 Tax=Pigmentiphaga humi TaxID=2478468 RepID=A0A3P4B6C7_9BURK|nr:porin [Pigmentiphaga humi]VCU71481.1 Outer membrane porin protein precursor [Pigmentiphaga humi]